MKKIYNVTLWEKNVHPDQASNWRHLLTKQCSTDWATESAAYASPNLRARIRPRISGLQHFGT